MLLFVRMYFSLQHNFRFWVVKHNPEGALSLFTSIFPSSHKGNFLFVLHAYTSDSRQKLHVKPPRKENKLILFLERKLDEYHSGVKMMWSGHYDIVVLQFKGQTVNLYLHHQHCFTCLKYLSMPINVKLGRVWKQTQEFEIDVFPMENKLPFIFFFFLW